MTRDVYLEDVASGIQTACTKCGEMKKFKDFPRGSGRRDGRHSWCRSCMSGNARSSQQKTARLALENGPAMIAILMADSRIDKAGCRMWTGAVHKKGYGLYNSQPVHVLWWVAHNGPVPEGLVLAHSCHKKLCLIHARPVTQAVNIWETPPELRSRKGINRRAVV